MTSQPIRSALLLVDDRREQRLALTAVLSELDVEIVEATSGRAALRELLQRDFAVILLDVNMPDMDGFETAALVRQRKSSEHTPIIFITAYGDDTHAMRGYSLGAVDYILAPIDPQVLKTKVAVFLELYRKSEEANRHARALGRHAAQLRRLAEAAVAIHGARSLPDLLKIVADTAASIVGAQQVGIEVEAPVLAPRPGSQRGRPERHSVFRPEEAALALLARRVLAHAPPTPIRVGEETLDGIPPWTGLGMGQNMPGLRGWLAAPLPSRDGKCLGWIQLSEKREGEFGPEDEALVVQLAQMTSIAVENTLFNEAQEASRLKDQFLATLSHELRTPLQSILTWCGLLRDPVDAATLQRGLEVVERNARAQRRLIEDLLDVSRIISGKLVIDPTWLSLGEVVETAIEDAKVATGDARIEIVHASDARPQVRGDPQRLRQVFDNLLANAIKFTPEGGRVTVRVGASQDEAHVTVQDNGIGIAAEFMPHLFERFRQADSTTTRSHAGLGIGLAIVRHLVELHGGSVDAGSDGEGKGSTFVVRLPLATQEHGEETHGAKSAARAQRLDGVRVLLVEDEVDARECLVLTLEQHGAEVEAFGSPAEALAALDTRQADVLVSDLAMPAEDGFSLIRRLRGRPPERGGRMPAAALSAYARPEERARALLAGFDLHLAKPIDPKDLVTAVRELAQARHA